MEEDDKTVPHAEYEAVVAERDSLKAEQGKWETGRVTELETKLTDKDAEITTLTTQWERERTMFSAGLTDTDGQGLAEHFYSKLTVEEGKEKPAFSEWLKFDGEGVTPPKGLAPYLPASSADGGETKPDINAGAKNSKPTAGTLTDERAKAVREEAARTGNWAPWKEFKKALLGVK